VHVASSVLIRRRARRAALGVLLASSGALCVSAREARGQVFTEVGLDLQPGMLTADFVSARNVLGSTTGFNARFLVRPVAGSWCRWCRLRAGVNITPYGMTGPGGREENTPSLFVGHAFPVLASARTAGWLSIEFPLQFHYEFGGGGRRNERLYGRDLFLEAAATVHVGRKLLGGLGPVWSRLTLYLLVDQSLTPNPDLLTGRTDRFNPIALYGLSIPLTADGGAR
jgi:hypothetical protein